MLFRQIGHYTLANILSASVSFLMIPIYTKYLDVEEYGIYAIALVFLNIFSILIHLNLNMILSRDYYSSFSDHKKYIFNMIILFFIIYLILNMLIYICSPLIATYWKLFSITWICIILFVAFIGSVNNLFFLLLRLEDKSKEFFKIKTIMSVSTAIFGYLFIIASFGWYSLILNVLIAQILLLLFFYINYSNYFKNSINVALIKNFLRFAFSILPTTLNWRLIDYADRFFLAKLIDMQSVGSYSLGYQVSNGLRIFIDGINSAWVPFYMKHMHSGRYHFLYKYIISYIIILLVCIAFVYYATPYVIHSLFREEYYQAIPFIRYFIFIIFLNTIHSLVSQFILFYREERKIAYATTLGMIINLPLNYILIKQHGAIGAAQATLISYFLIIVVELFFAKNISKLKKDVNYV